jgi:ATP-dependent helicase/nuclease subunit A
MIKTALSQQTSFETVPAFWNSEEEILRLVSDRSGALAAGELADSRAAAPQVILPDWLQRGAKSEGDAMPLVRPSRVLEEPVRGIDAPGRAQARHEAAPRGRLIHLLLQYLPGVAAQNRHTAALAFLSARAASLDDTARQNLAEEALKVIDLPELAGLFGPGSKAEVSVAGRIASGQRMIDVAGQVDRIGEGAKEILVADYKTGTPCTLDDTPPAYLAQMALYRAVLAPLWPDKTLRMLLIWTEGPFVVPVPANRLDAALAAVMIGSG